MLELILGDVYLSESGIVKGKGLEFEFYFQDILAIRQCLVLDLSELDLSPSLN